MPIYRKSSRPLSKRQTDAQSDMAGYAGVVRQSARDLTAVFRQSQFTARHPGRMDTLALISDPKRFPGIDSVTALTDLFFEEMRWTGEVERFKGDFIDNTGNTETGPCC